MITLFSAFEFLVLSPEGFVDRSYIAIDIDGKLGWQIEGLSDRAVVQTMELLHVRGFVFEIFCQDKVHGFSISFSRFKKTLFLFFGNIKFESKH